MDDLQPCACRFVDGEPRETCLYHDALAARLARVERLAAMIRDPRQWIQNEWTTRISQELDCALRATDSASGVQK